MGQKLDFADLITGSVKYAFSDTTSFILAGIACLLSFFLVGIPLVAGYAMRCIRGLLKGEEKLPLFADDLGDMFVDGLIVCLVFFLQYILVMVVMFAFIFGMVFVVLGLTFGGTIVLPGVGTAVGTVFGVIVQVCLTFVLILLMMVWSCTIAVSAVIYADRGSWAEAMNPLKAIALIRRDIGGFLVALVVLLVVGFISQIASVLIVTVPWVMAFQLLASVFVMTKFYRHAAEQTISGTGTTP
jgi:hypothetical protein